MQAYFIIPVLLLSSVSYSQEPLFNEPPAAIQVTTDVWPGFTDNDETGAYFDLIKLIYQPYQTQLDVSFTSYSRALLLVRQKKADLTLGVSTEHSDNLLMSEQPIDQDKIYAVYHPDKLARPTIDKLPAYRLAWNLAYDFGSILGVSNDGYEVASVQHGLDLVLNGRVDIYLAEHSQVLFHLKESNSNLAPLAGIWLASDDIYVGFANNKRGRLLKKIWDKRHRELMNSGELQTFYSHYQEFYLPAK